MDIPPAQRSPWPLAFAITLALMVALMTGQHEIYFETRVLEQGDTAVNGLQIDDAKSLSELYGNYSRFQFNHPGPGLFYLYAGGEIVLHDWLHLVPSPHNAHLLTSLLLQTLCFGLALALLHCWIQSWTFVALALLGGVWHFAQTRSAFISIWPPHVLLMPFLLFMAAVSSFAHGRTRDLSIMVVTGSLLFHGHVAQPLFVGGLGLLAAWLHFRGLRAEGRWSGFRSWFAGHRALAWFCASWIALMLLPLLIDLVLYRTESNVATIIRRFLVNADEPKTILQSLLYFLSFSTYATNQEELFSQITGESWRFFGEHAVAVVLWLTCILVPAGFIFWRRAHPSPTGRFLRTAYLVWFATMPLCIGWGLVQHGPMVQFNGFFYYGVYYFAGLLGLGLLCAVPGRMLPVPVTAALCAVAAIGASWFFRSSRWPDDIAGMVLQNGVKAALQDHAAGRPVLLVFEHYTWPEAASVALELQRRGIPFHTSPSWNFMFGRRHDLSHLGPSVPDAADIWWITRPGPGGKPITKDLSIFTRPAPVDPRNTLISFAGQANGYRYLVSGLSTGNIDFAWSDQRRLELRFAALPTEQDVQLVIDAQLNAGIPAGTPQPAEVLLNGSSLGTLTLSARNQLSLTLPKDLWNSRPVGTLEFRFPAARPFKYFSRPASQLWHAWGLWRLWFASTTASQPVPTLENEPTVPALAVDGRIDFTAAGNLGDSVTSGLGRPGQESTRTTDSTVNLVFRREPTAHDLLVQLVAHPYADGATPGPQRCEITVNDQLVFRSPFVGPGVARFIVSRDLWNSHPLTRVTIHLPDATPAESKDAVRHGMEIRWLSVTPQPQR